VGEPIVLFSASEVKWPLPFCGEKNYVTDGPFIIKNNDHLEMIWSSYCSTGYAIGKCKSKSILGPWTHLEKPIYSDDGGHAMIFDMDGTKQMAFHKPNTFDGRERLVLVPYELND
jgi:beta-xylosidase